MEAESGGAVFAATDTVTYAGWVVGVIGGLTGVAGYLTGAVRKSVAAARDADIASLRTHCELLDEKIVGLQAAVKACEERDKAKELVIANLSSQIKAGDELVRVAQEVAARLAALEAKKP